MKTYKEALSEVIDAVTEYKAKKSDIFFKTTFYCLDDGGEHWHICVEAHGHRTSVSHTSTDYEVDQLAEFIYG